MLFRAVSLILLSVAIWAAPACAEDPHRAQRREAAFSEFAGHGFPSEDLKERIHFWRLIFSKYGKNQIVFHHRQYPGIVYSVLDYEPRAKSYSDAQLERIKDREGLQEVRRIQTALLNLGRGAQPQNKFEERLIEMFQHVPGKGPAKFREAGKVENIRSQTGIRERFMMGVARAGRYIPVMERILKAQGLPVELARVPLIESSFDYDAYSSVGAAGIWQFMRATARNYMRVTNSIDERLDPIIATQAAAQYLSHAHDRLGTWPLAVTSYNHGVGGMAHAVSVVGTQDIEEIIRTYRSKTFGFASQNFYPEFITALEIERNWRDYFPNLPREAPVEFDQVRLAKPSPYLKLQLMSGVGAGEFERLNQALLAPVKNRGASVPAGFLLKVGKGYGSGLIKVLGGGRLVSVEDAAQSFETAAEEVKHYNQVNTQRYKVQRGETLGKIAYKFHVSIGALMNANNISDARKVRQGQSLIIPGSRSSSARSEMSSRPAKTAGEIYVVQSGDTLGGIAKQRRISIATLKKLNPKIGTTIYAGQKLRVK